MDPIEIKIEEIIDYEKMHDEHLKKMAASMKGEVAYFEKMNQDSGGGGFMGMIMNKLGGGKGGGMMEAGAAGGLAAAGIMELVSILGDAVSQSKILTTIFGTIGKALGLLIDVILLPFLPILITGIIWLFQGIMEFYKLWNGIWSSKVVQNIAAGIVSLVSALAKGIGGLLTLGLNFLSGAASAAWAVLQWVWGLAVKGASAVLSFVFSAFGVVWNVLNWLWGIITKGAANLLKFDLSILGDAYNFMKWLWNSVTSGGINLVVNLLPKGRPQDKVFWEQFGLGGVFQAGSDFAGWLKSAGFFEYGGVVPGSGPQLAVVHGGETIIPAGKSVGGGNHFHFYGYNDAQLQRSVENILRRQNNRYNA